MKLRVATLLACSLFVAGLHVSPAWPQTSGKIGTLLAAGDISWCPHKGETYAAKTGELIKKVIEESKVPVRVLALGDLAYKAGTKKELECFAKNWKAFEDVLMPVPGNHEYLGGVAAPYFEHFADNPYVHQNDNTADKLTDTRWDKKGYFAVGFPDDQGPWRLIGLNDNFQYEEKYKKDMADQLTWLDKQLDMTGEGHKPKCVLALWHAPLFSSGRHGHVDYAHTKPGKELSRNRSMQTAFRKLLAHGASVVLAGHDHNFEQFAPHDADGKPAADGIRSFVVGTGGSRLTEDFYSKLAATSEGGPYGNVKGNQGLLKLDLYEDHYTWDFLPVEGQNGNKDIPLQVTRQNCNQPK